MSDPVTTTVFFDPPVMSEEAMKSIIEAAVKAVENYEIVIVAPKKDE